MMGWRWSSWRGWEVLGVYSRGGSSSRNLISSQASQTRASIVLDYACFRMHMLAAVYTKDEYLFL